MKEKDELVMGGFYTIKKLYEEAKKDGKEDYVVRPIEYWENGTYRGATHTHYDDDEKTVLVIG